jgi:hypothetical protein
MQGHAPYKAAEQIIVFDKLISVPSTAPAGYTHKLRSIKCIPGKEAANFYETRLSLSKYRQRLVKGTNNNKEKQVNYTTLFLNDEFRDDEPREQSAIRLELCYNPTVGSLYGTNKLAEAEWQRCRYRNRRIVVTEPRFPRRGTEGVNWTVKNNAGQQWVSHQRYLHKVLQGEYFLLAISEYHYLILSIERFGDMQIDNDAFTQLRQDIFAHIKVQDLNTALKDENNPAHHSNSVENNSALPEEDLPCINRASFMSAKECQAADRIMDKNNTTDTANSFYQNKIESRPLIILTFIISALISASIYYNSQNSMEIWEWFAINFMLANVVTNVTAPSRIININKSIRLNYPAISAIRLGGACIFFGTFSF